MPSVLVPLADGFEEIEAVTIIDVLRRADIDVTTAGLTGTNVTGSHDIALQADALLDDVIGQDFDLIALPGGPGAQSLKNHDALLLRLQQQASAGKPLAAICAAPMILADAGLLFGRKATSYPGFVSADDCDYLEEPVVIDNGLTTSRGPSTALRFALALVEQLAGSDKRMELEEKMLVHQHGAN